MVAATKKSIDAAARKFDEVGVRTRAIQRKLRDVQDLPVGVAAVAPTIAVLGLPEADDADADSDLPDGAA